MKVAAVVFQSPSGRKYPYFFCFFPPREASGSLQAPFIQSTNHLLRAVEPITRLPGNQENGGETGVAPELHQTQNHFIKFVAADWLNVVAVCRPVSWLLAVSYFSL